MLGDQPVKQRNSYSTSTVPNCSRIDVEFLRWISGVYRTEMHCSNADSPARQHIGRKKHMEVTHCRPTKASTDAKGENTGPNVYAGSTDSASLQKQKVIVCGHWTSSSYAPMQIIFDLKKPSTLYHLGMVPSASRDLLPLFAALSDKTRLRLVNLVAGREVCVCYLAEVLRLSQPKISRHLAYLRKAGMVSARREGNWMHYCLQRPDDKAKAAILDSVLESLQLNPEMQSDRARLIHVCREPIRRCDPASSSAITYKLNPTG